MHKSTMKRIWEFEKQAENTALIDDKGQSVTYRMLKEVSDSVAELIEERSLVFSLCSNEIGSVIGYVGFLNNGIVLMDMFY